MTDQKASLRDRARRERSQKFIPSNFNVILKAPEIESATTIASYLSYEHEPSTVEINEAFAAQVLGCVQLIESDHFAKKELGRDKAIGRLELDRLNVNGGAIALGHPVGVTGNRLILTALKELHRRGDQHALVSLCIGGGQGGAIILERAS